MSKKSIRSEDFVTDEVRVMFVHLMEPKQTRNGKNRWSVTALIPKSNQKLVGDIWGRILKTSNEAWPGVAEAILRKGNPLKDGDTTMFEDASDPTKIGKLKKEFYPEFAGHYFVDCGSFNPVGVADPSGSMLITNPTEVYSGMWCRLLLNCYTYQNERTGVNLGLKAVQKTRDGERIGGGGPVDATRAFAPIPGGAPTGGPSFPGMPAVPAGAPMVAQPATMPAGFNPMS